MRRNDRQASGYNEDLSWRERLLAAFRDRERVRSRRPKIDWLREVEGETRKKEKGRKRKRKERKRRRRDREWERRSGCAGCVNYLHTVCIYPEIYKRAARVWFTHPCARSPGETAKRVLPGEICNRMRLRLHPPESSTSGLAPALLFFLEGIISSSSFLNQLSYETLLSEITLYSFRNSFQREAKILAVSSYTSQALNKYHVATSRNCWRQTTINLDGRAPSLRERISQKQYRDKEGGRRAE